MSSVERVSARSRAVGFTLIELLVVIAIIAVLIGIALPAIGRARDAARGAACLAKLHSVGHAVSHYADMNKEQFPLSSHTTGNLLDKGNWMTTLQEYGITPTYRICPMDVHRHSSVVKEYTTSYATNEHFERLAPGVDYDPITGKPLPGGRPVAFTTLASVPVASAAIYMFEPEGEVAVDHYNTHAFKDADDVRETVAVTRHMGSGHYLFADWHAKAWTWSDFRSRFKPEASPFDPLTAR